MADIGDNNLGKLKTKIAQAIQNIRDLKAERAGVNESIAAIRSALEAEGIPKAALDMAMRYLNWEPEKRAGFDLAYRLVREAGGLPMETDDLITLMQKEADKPKAKKGEEADD